MDSTLGSQWTDQSVRLCLWNHVGLLVVCRVEHRDNGRQLRTEVKVIRARVDRPGTVKGDFWVLTDGPEQSGDQSWWVTLETRTHARTWWSGLCCRHGRGLARHTSGHGGCARGAGLAMGLVVWASKLPSAMDGRFC
jgi:hypothetical protein